MNQFTVQSGTYVLYPLENYASYNNTFWYNYEDLIKYKYIRHGIHCLNIRFRNRLTVSIGT